MKSKMKIKMRVVRNLWYLPMVLFIASCAKGFDNNETFSSGVSNTQLLSPAEDGITFSKSADEKTFTVKWPVVLGASAYQVLLQIVDDPENPETVLDKTVDGCSLEVEMKEDTKYQVAVKSLGNVEYNNADAKESSLAQWSSLIPTIATIPSGSDIAEWFAANPIQDTGAEMAYDLEANGTYTLNSPLDFAGYWITFRGDKIHHPKVTMGTNGLIKTRYGLKIKYIDFDCTGVDQAAQYGSFLTMSETPDESTLVDGKWYPMLMPIVIQSCNIKGIARSLVYNGGKNYIISGLYIKDCIVELNTAQDSKKPVISFTDGGRGCINDLEISNSTFYDLSKGGNFFIQYANNAAGSTNLSSLFSSSSVKLLNNTFYNVAYSKNFANYSGMKNSKVTITVMNNIFQHCGTVQKLFNSGNKQFSNNAYYEEVDGDVNKQSTDGSEFQEDPGFTNPTSGNFAVSSSTIIVKKVGDPRWLQ